MTDAAAAQPGAQASGPRRWWRSVAVVAALTVLSRCLGFARDVLLAAALGTGAVAVAFMLAFRLSNQLRAFLAEGAFTAAFQPIDAALPPGSSGAGRFRAEVLGWLICGNVALLAVVLVAPSAVLRLMAPGYPAGDPVHDLASDLLRITFPYLICVSVMAYFGARLASRGQFATVALAPSLMNLCLIGAMLLAKGPDAAGFGAAWAVFVSGLLQVALVLWAVRRAGIGLTAPRLGLSPQTRRFFRNLGPALLSSGAVQVAVLIDTVLATFLGQGTLAHLYFADRLYQLPIGVLSMALGTVLLPEVARRLAAGDSRGQARAVLQAMALCTLIGAPAALAMAVYGEPIVALLFERGSFGAADSAATAGILLGYAVGLVPALLVRPLVVGFHGRGDTATPLRLLLIALAVNLACKLLLVPQFGGVGLALGTSAGALAYSMLLASVLMRRKLLV